MQLQHYNLTGTTETLQEDSHDWSGAVDGYSLLRKDKPGWQGAGVARYVREQYECTELCLGTDDEPVKKFMSQD